MASKPNKMNSKNVRRFSGLGLVTKMFVKPQPTAPATASPSAADFPRPLAAVTEHVANGADFSVTTSRSRSSTFAWQSVRHLARSGPMGFVSDRDCWREDSSMASSDLEFY